MAKINRNNAEQIIGEMLKGYEVKKASNGSKYIEMPEAEYSETVATILNNCTKELGYHIARYTEVYNCAWLDNARVGRISTYRTDYAFVKLI